MQPAIAEQASSSSHNWSVGLAVQINVVAESNVRASGISDSLVVNI